MVQQSPTTDWQTITAARYPMLKHGATYHRRSAARRILRGHYWWPAYTCRQREPSTARQARLQCVFFGEPLTYCLVARELFVPLNSATETSATVWSSPTMANRAERSFPSCGGESVVTVALETQASPPAQSAIRVALALCGFDVSNQVFWKVG